MSLKIEFYTKCFNCLYESSKPRTLNWFDSSPNETTTIPSEDNLVGMLNNLHKIKNIVCENCHTNNHLAFAIIKINDSPYKDIFKPNTGVNNEFSIHNKIVEIAPSSWVLFHLKNGTYKIGQVREEMTGLSDGDKTYWTRVFFKCENYNEIENFKVKDGYTYDQIELSEIKDVKPFAL